ncbi:MAG: hypothetical protein AAF975_03705 [Spirochaetota bacterium]
MSELHLTERETQQLSGYVLNELKKLSAQAQNDFITAYRAQSKSLGLAYCLLLLLFGLQYAYIGKWGKQILYWLTAAGAGIWGIVLLFTLPKVIGEYNRDLAMKELAKYS